MQITFLDDLSKINKNSINVFFLTKDYCENNFHFLNTQYDFKAEYNEKIIFNDENNKISVAIGLGDDNDLSVNNLEYLGNSLLKYLENNKFKYATIFYNSNTKNINKNFENKIFKIITGLELSSYNFNKYLLPEKQKEKSIKIKNIDFIVENTESIKKKYNDFLIVKENVFLCRNLVNEPSNVINPDTYSEICKQLVEYGLEVTILGEEEMAKLGMNSLLAVGQGSNYESKLVILKWKGLDNFENPVAFVGKGITFDSGGISIKPDDAMYDMKCDMAGSAVVVSTLKLLAQRKAKVNAVGVIALVENMPSGSAVKPGDIVESMSKQTIEILHTDAEGRLILADSLYYTVTNFNPIMIIDLATLTGACCVALGSANAGIFTNSNELADEINKSSKDTGENSWRMPLVEFGGTYDKMIDSDIADVKNISGVRLAGAITAAQFLQRFINKHKKWAHIDIAGTAFLTSAELYSAKNIYTVDNGATGYGVRLLNNLIMNNYEQQ